MSEKDNEQVAAELAKRAAREGKTAAKDAAKAAKVAAEPVVEEVQDNAEKLEGTIEDAAQAARRINPVVVRRISGDLCLGFIALTGSIYAGAIAYDKFADARGFLKGYRAGLADLADQQVD